MARRKTKTPVVVVAQTQAPPAAPRRRGQQRRQNQQRRRPRRQNRANGTAGMSRQMSPVVDLVKSMANPWDYSACIPDGTLSRGCFTLRETGNLTTGAGGTQYGIFLGNDPENYRYAITNATNTTPTITGNWSACASTTAVHALYSSYRVVSAGIRITYTGNTLNDQGVLFLAEFDNDVAINAFNGATVDVFAKAALSYKIVPLRGGGTVTWRPKEMMEQSEYMDITTAPSAVSANLNTTYLCAWVFGAAAAGASSAQYEIVTNFEGKFIDQTFRSGVDANISVAAEPGWFEKASKMVGQIKQIGPGLLEDAINMGASLYSTIQSARGLAAISGLAPV